MIFRERREWGENRLLSRSERKRDEALSIEWGEGNEHTIDGRGMIDRSTVIHKAIKLEFHKSNGNDSQIVGF